MTVLKGAFVTYCNEAKIMLAVAEEIYEELIKWLD